jgi:4-hydroxy-3-methylbut-2-enyl diphosphate reductase
MRMILAQPRGFCAGVTRAIQIVELALAQHGAPIYVRRAIVHNRHVVNDLGNRGVFFVEELDQVPDRGVVIFSAHGVARSVVAQARERGLRAIDATCPLVTKVHREVHRYLEQGYHLVLIGHEGHAEVVGTLGQASAGQVTLVTSLEQARAVDLARFAKLMVLTQTTLSIDDCAEIIDVLAARYPRLEQPPADDICYATQNRQNAVRALAAQCQLVLIVGSANSSNAQRLVEVCRRQGLASFLVEDAGGLESRWFEGVDTVGLSAGASTPERLVDDVIAALRVRGVTRLQVQAGDVEDAVFSLPPELQPKGRPMGRSI